MDRLCGSGSESEGEESSERNVFCRVNNVCRGIVDPLDMCGVALCEVVACKGANVVRVEIVQSADEDLLALKLK
jgi:hypothetical protein